MLKSNPSVIRATLRQSNYSRYIFGNGLSLIGTWMQRIAVGWLTWELTHSPAWLGVIAMADFAPVILLGPLGGALADRHSRILVMVWAQVVAALSALVLFALSASDLLNVWHLVIFTFLTGCAMGINQPARLSLAPSLVPRELLTTAISLNAMIFNGARFVGPMISTAVITLWSIHGSFLINTCSYIALILALLSLKIPQGNRPATDDPQRSLLYDISEGIRFIHSHASIRLVIVIMATAAFCLRSVIELLPGLTSDVFGKGADEFAVLTAAFGIGAIGAGTWMARRGGMDDQPIVALWGVLGTAVFGIALVATKEYIIALPVALSIGFTTVIAGIGMQTTLHFVTPPAMRGRVMSLYGIIHIGGAGVGAFVLGVIAEHTGLRPPIAAAAVIGMVIWYTVWRQRRVIVQSLQTTTTPSKQRK